MAKFATMYRKISAIHQYQVRVELKLLYNVLLKMNVPLYNDHIHE